MQILELVKKIEKTDNTLKMEAQKKIDFKTKPVGSLGMLESIAVKMSQIRQSLNPDIKSKAMFVFAGDHGIASEGVSAFPAEVTPQMVLNFLNGGAAINVLCRHNNIGISIVDMGVNFDFNKAEGLIDRKIAMGTRNFLKGEAMTETEALRALQAGADVFFESAKSTGLDLAGVGDMGIGNTTSSSAIISAVTGLAPDKTTGRGTGIDDEKLKAKIKMIETALSIHKPDRNNPLDILKKIGGFEIAGIAGAILASAFSRTPIVIDGIISTAAALIAYKFNPNVSDYIFAGHKSVEIGQKAALELMRLSPILQLDMRLGEGTGAALAMNIIEASCRIMREMASFEEAGVSSKD